MTRPPARSRSERIRDAHAMMEAAIAVGTTRDVVLIRGVAEVRDPDAVPDRKPADYAAQTDWDPRQWPGMVFIEVSPRRIPAWREENEIGGRVLMDEGRWLEER